METKKVLDAATGTGQSEGYLIDQHSEKGNEVLVFVSLSEGSAVVELSADNVDFVPVQDGAMTEGGVKVVDASVGSYLRVRYTGITSGISATIQPKHESNG